MLLFPGATPPETKERQQKAMRKQAKAAKPKETHIQQDCVKWYRAQWRQYKHLLAAIPNGAYLAGDARQRAMQANRLYAEGMVPGFPDLFLARPLRDFSGGPIKYAGLFIEMKRPGEKARPEQVEIHLTLMNAGYAVEVIDSVDKFKTLVDNYMHGRYFRATFNTPTLCKSERTL